MVVEVEVEVVVATSHSALVGMIARKATSNAAMSMKADIAEEPREL